MCHGQCACGKVRYTVEMPTLFCCHCHCEYCRRAHGAAFVTWFGIKQEQFHVTGGEAQLKWYQDSGPSRRGFCGVCGSPLFFASSLNPGEIHIALASINEEIDRPPSAHVFSDFHAKWYPINDELPCFPSDAKELEAYQQVEPFRIVDE